MKIKDPILVTGATGFIGKRLVGQLINLGLKVRALVLANEKIDESWSDKVEVIRGDITNKQSVAEACSGVKTIYHLAAVVADWGADELHAKVTVGGTLNILNAALKENAHFILVSSVVVYGDKVQSSICFEDAGFGNYLGPYSKSKQAQERIAWNYFHDYNLALTVVRPTNVYGPGSQPWVHDVLEQLKSGMPALVSGGKANAGLCYVDNLVSLLILVGQNPKSIGQAYNCSDGSDVTWGQYFTDLAKISKAKTPTSIPYPFAKLSSALVEGLWKLGRFKGRPPLTLEALNLVGSNHRVPIEKAQKELGYVPAVTYAEGLEKVQRYIVDRPS